MKFLTQFGANFLSTLLAGIILAVGGWTYLPPNVDYVEDKTTDKSSMNVTVSNSGFFPGTKTYSIASAPGIVVADDVIIKEGNKYAKTLPTDESNKILLEVTDLPKNETVIINVNGENVTFNNY